MSLHITADTVITGDGEVIDDGAVRVEENTIVAVGPGEDITAGPDDEEYRFQEHTLLPGLIDAHTHISSRGDADRSGYTVNSTTADRVIHTIENARASVDAGVTTVRDVGSPGNVPMVVRDAINQETVKGPRIVTCGQGLTATGGHGQPLPDHLTGMDVPVNGYVANGKWEVTEGVRTQLQRGADAIKVWATGGVIDPEGEIETLEYSQAELDAIVAEADRHDVHVAAHAHPPTGIKACVEAGVRSIEHGMYMDTESIEMMADNGVFLASTLSVMHRLMEHPNVPEYYRTNTEQAIDHHVSKLPEAVDADVQLVMGTDAGAPTYPHGNNVDELKYLVEAGIDPLEAIEIGTRQTANLLEFDDLGVLKEGYLADLIAVRGDPLEDIEVLTDSPNIEFVVTNGTVSKRPEA